SGGWVREGAVEHLPVPVHPQIVSRAGDVDDIHASVLLDAVDAVADSADGWSRAQPTLQLRARTHGSHVLSIGSALRTEGTRAASTTARRKSGGGSVASAARAAPSPSRNPVWMRPWLNASLSSTRIRKGTL